MNFGQNADGRNVVGRVVGDVVVGNELKLLFKYPDPDAGNYTFLLNWGDPMKDEVKGAFGDPLVDAIPLDLYISDDENSN